MRPPARSLRSSLTTAVPGRTGCAKTVRNDNSSRMGKFTALNFDPSARIQGASLNTYLLEKTRVTQCGPGERSYHCFYALLRGASPALLKQLRLPSAEPSAYAYLAGGHTGESGGERTDKMLWAELETALAAQAWEGAALQELWQLIAGVLLLGNVRFDAANTDAAAVEGSSAPSVAGCEAVLGLQQGSLAKALTKRKLKVGGDMVEKDLSLVAAGDNRDALAKAIYSKLFDRLIVQINRALAEARNIYSPRATAHVIGIVDIFGFEIFEKNSLEQLCINFANEKLQALFTKTVFAETMRAYSEEGIDAADISYTDNGALIQTLEAPNTGLLAILSEECVVPKGSDEGFTEKVMAQHGKGGIIVRMKGVGPKDGFGINHFAGLVNYGTRAWLDKNKDPLNGDLVVLMQFSDNELLKELFTEPADVAPAAGDRKKFKSTKFKGVTDTFSAQLTDLVGTLDKCDLHFVRCFKSNDQKKPDLVEDAVITRQLNTSGVLDALRVARTGFPDRMPFDEFCGNFLVVPGLGTKAELAGKAPKDRVLALLQKLGVPGQKFRCGKARVFFASGVLEGLRTRRLEMQAKVAVAIQAAGRGHIARKAARQLRRVREEALQAMLSAAAQEDVEALRAAIADARAAGVHRYAAGEASVAGAEERVAALVAELRARREAEGALEKAIGAADIAELEVALQRAAGCKSDRALLERGERRLATLKEEEKRRKEEEARLAEIKRKNVAAAAEAEKKVAEERRKREAEMASRDAALVKQQTEAKLRQKEARVCAPAAPLSLAPPPPSPPPMRLALPLSGADQAAEPDTGGGGDGRRRVHPPLSSGGGGGVALMPPAALPSPRPPPATLPSPRPPGDAARHRGGGGAAQAGETPRQRTRHRASRAAHPPLGRTPIGSPGARGGRRALPLRHRGAPPASIAAAAEVPGCPRYRTCARARRRTSSSTPSISAWISARTSGCCGSRIRRCRRTTRRGGTSASRPTAICTTCTR